MPRGATNAQHRAKPANQPDPESDSARRARLADASESVSRLAPSGCAPSTCRPVLPPHSSRSATSANHHINQHMCGCPLITSPLLPSIKPKETSATRRRSIQGSNTGRSTMSEISTGSHHGAGTVGNRLKKEHPGRWAAWFGRTEPDQRTRRHHPHLWPGRRPGRPSWPTPESAAWACRWSRSPLSTPTSPT